MADLSDLLTEISPDAPSGENLEYDNVRIALDANIQGTPENQFTGEKAQPPNWREIQKEAIGLLQRSKDLQVTLYLIRSLIAMESIKGFRDGLNLLNHTLEHYWESVHPQLDPDDGLDPTFRVNILEELVSQELVLHALTVEPIIESRSVGRFCLRDIQYATDRIPVPESGTKPELSTIKAAFLDVDAEALQANYQAILDALQAANLLEQSVGEKVGATNGPNLAALRSLLKEMQSSYEQMAGARLADAGDESDEGDAFADDSGSSAGSSSTQVRSTPGKISSRQDVLKALDAIGKYYSDFEPSSPVPVFLERAKFLVTADFASIIQNLLPDAMSQLEVFKGPNPDDDSDSSY